MRRILPFFVILNFVLSACAKPGDGDGSTAFGDFGDTSNATGASSPTSHSAYISGGDSRVGSTSVPVMPSTPKAFGTTQAKPNPITPDSTAAERASDPAEQEDTPSDNPPVVDNSLKGRIREFEISRFDSDSSDYRRFGSSTVSITIYLTENETLVFDKLKLKQDKKTKIFSFSGKAANGRYTLKGKSLEDIADKRGGEAYKSKGEFDLFDTSKNESAKIWYNAYKARLKVSEDQMTPVKSGSYADTRLKALRTDTFGWVYNWAVDSGVAFYLVDILRRIHSNQPQPLDAKSLAMPVFKFKGESVRTDKKPSAATSLTADFSKVQTVGNAKNEGLRLVTAELEDPQTKNKTDFMMDIVEDDPSQPSVDDGEVASADVPDPTQALPPQGNDAGKRQTKPAPTKTRPSAPKIGNSYLTINTSSTRAAILDRDVLNNADVPDVINNLRSKSERSRLDRFFWYAAPFKDFIERVASGFQTPTAFVYPSVVESEYFKGSYTFKKGDYSQKKHRYLADGMFQIHDENMRALKMTIQERNYFTSAACGAALLMNENIDLFLKYHADTTFALLAFNSGGPVAKDLALRYRKKYSYLVRASAGMDQNYIDYANHAIAIYLLARDLKGNGFIAEKSTNTKLPTNKTVTPPSPILNPTCRQIVEAAGLSGI